jgi:hypothetical protein
MPQDEGPWIVAGVVVLVVLPVLVEWLRRRPPHSPQRLIGWALVCTSIITTAVAVLALEGIGTVWLASTLGAGVVVCSVPLALGWAKLRAAHRHQEESQFAPDHLPTGPARLWVRPRQAEAHVRGSIVGRVDRWLATDGPAPTAGWWHNGGLVLDERGPALMDAAGLRHGLPSETSAMIWVAAPRAVLLVDDDQSLLARLPTTGFDTGDLRKFAAAAGWRYGDVFGPGRTARGAVDLRVAVADRAARDHRLARARNALFRSGRT